MTNPASSMTPGSRPRRGVIGVLALLGVGALTTGLVLAAGEATDPPRVAAAVELATFSSCEDLAAWGAEATQSSGDDVMVDEATSGEAMATSGAAPSMQRDAALAGDPGSVDPAPPTTMPMASTTTMPATEPDEEEDDADAPADDETNVAVEGVDEIDLVDRLTEDVVLVASASRLAIVDLDEAAVVEATSVAWDAEITYDAVAGVAWVVGPSETGGVLVERYAVDTEGLESEGRWTTTGWLVDARRVGDELHVVATDGFVGGFDGDVPGTVPPDVDGTGPATEPAADSPVPFDGGPVPCDEVLHPSGPSDPSATLLVTLPATGAVEPVRATEVVGSGSHVHVTTEAIYLATPQWSEQGTTTGIHRFDLATLDPTGSGEVEGTLLDDFSMSEHEGALRVATTADAALATSMPVEGEVDGVSEPTITGVPGPGFGPPLNEIVVLDTEGALDEIGRTERFGHPGETLHGIRFAGTTAYAVTFLETDPFYVVDLADPTAPAVVGEVELPGFSSYLHPLGDGLVVGFGPGDRGMAAKLFDVSDPTAPAVVGELALGDDSPVAYDPHAYLDLGDGRFAVPAASYDISEATIPDAGRASSVGGVASSVVVVDTTGGRLVEESRSTALTSEVATRVIRVDDGWALLAGPEIVVLDAAGDPSGRITL